MILILFAALCLVSVPLTGGHLGRMADIRVRGLWLVAVALTIQILITVIITSGSPAFHDGAHIISYVFAGLFLWANRRLPGAKLIGAGAGLNALAIVVNHGVMPASAAAERLVGQKLGAGFHNAGPVAHSHLAWLGDVIPIPGPAHLHNVISVGDVLLYAGMLVLLHCVCRRPSVTAVALEAPEIDSSIEPLQNIALTPVELPRPVAERPRATRRSFPGLSPVGIGLAGFVVAVGVQSLLATRER